MPRTRSRCSEPETVRNPSSTSKFSSESTMKMHSGCWRTSSANSASKPSISSLVAPHSVTFSGGTPRMLNMERMMMRCTGASSIPMARTCLGITKEMICSSPTCSCAVHLNSKTVPCSLKAIEHVPSIASAHLVMIQAPSPLETESVGCRRTPFLKMQPVSSSASSLAWPSPGLLKTRSVSWPCTWSSSVRTSPPCSPYLHALEIALRWIWKTNLGSSSSTGKGSTNVRISKRSAWPAQRTSTLRRLIGSGLGV
mmetsp:Transcript_26382/g.66962  ORF Transcript_26382/g.66962 Transcript_26382/m.66962 type:complete len:254 (+) Transcript_26382:717-1478(+)